MTSGARTLTVPKRICLLENLDLVPFTVAWEWQKGLVEQRIENPEREDILILLEHPPVYTLGTGATLDFLKFNLETSYREVHRIERGGEVTYHCPGQIVGYPILNLRYYQQDLHWYLRQLEEVIIRVLNQYQLKGYREANLTGVWLEGVKVAAIGIKVRRWITMHGFSLNVCPDLSGFDDIVPCGITDRSVGSLAQFVPEIQIDRVRQEIVNAFAEVFQVEFFDKYK
ncbi:MAG: lipoyl(octanoyl) transferase LipB [Xenococcaceae cyanobacterium]